MRHYRHFFRFVRLLTEIIESGLGVSYIAKLLANIMQLYAIGTSAIMIYTVETNNNTIMYIFVRYARQLIFLETCHGTFQV